MINKILAFTFLACMFIAIALSLVGITEVSMDRNFYTFFTIVQRRFNDWEDIAIPTINLIPSSFSEGGAKILDVVRNIGNALIQIINIAVIGITNVVLGLVKFFVALIWSVKDYIAFVQSPTS